MTTTWGLHLIVLAACSLLAVAILVAAAAPQAQAAECKGGAKPASQLSGKQARKATACLINKQRRARGLRRLKEHGAHRRAAKRHTRVMIDKRCFAHVCPGERDLVGRVSATGYLPCGCTWGLAENIAYGFGRRGSPRSIVAAWMRSPGHRVNILGRSFEHVGIGVRRGAPSGGSGAATYTADFGFRR